MENTGIILGNSQKLKEKPKSQFQEGRTQDSSRTQSKSILGEVGMIGFQPSSLCMAFL